MVRTRTRPLPAGKLDPRRALAFGLTLGVLGTIVLWSAAGGAAASIALAAILFYVFVVHALAQPRHAVRGWSWGECRARSLR